MRCDDLHLFQEWTPNWRGSGATFEIVPVVPSAETRQLVAPYLDQLEGYRMRSIAPKTAIGSGPLVCSGGPSTLLTTSLAAYVPSG